MKSHLVEMQNKAIIIISIIIFKIIIIIIIIIITITQFQLSAVLNLSTNRIV